ncbi:MAG: hypothetical protein JOZ49_23315 [Mycolicibacterium sp.]|nr:hypothetical protein [Mycolicibacterium sp.]
MTTDKTGAETAVRPDGDRFTISVGGKHPELSDAVDAPTPEIRQWVAGN